MIKLNLLKPKWSGYYHFKYMPFMGKSKIDLRASEYFVSIPRNHGNSNLRKISKEHTE